MPSRFRTWQAETGSGVWCCWSVLVLAGSAGFTRMRGRQLGVSSACDFCGHVEAVKRGCFLFRATDTPCSDNRRSSLTQGPHTVSCGHKINPGWPEFPIRYQRLPYGKKGGFSSKPTNWCIAHTWQWELSEQTVCSAPQIPLVWKKQVECTQFNFIFFSWNLR